MASDDLRKEVIAAVLALEEGGRIAAETVLGAARDKASVLHDLFEWDDSVAAEKHRMEQARGLVRRVTVIVEYSDRKVVVPNYLRDGKADDDQGYVSQQRLRREPANRRAALDYERVRVVGLIDRLYRIAVGLGDDEIAVACEQCKELLGG